MSSIPTSTEFSLERLSAHKKIVADIRTRAQQMFDDGCSGLEIAGVISSSYDDFLISLYEISLAALSPDDRALVERHGAMVAVGGTGRGELAPFSDIDLLFLYRKPATEAFARCTANMVRDCWDAGIELGHSLRTISDSMAMAGEEPQVATGLVEARLLSGSRPVFKKLCRKVKKFIGGKRMRPYIDACVGSRNEERAKHGGSVNCLEPDVKRSSGGLRDLHLIRWIGCAAFGRPGINALQRRGAFTVDEARQLHEAHEFLTHVRIDLHLAADRGSDLLSRDEQLRITKRLGFEGTPAQRPVERFMQNYFRHSSAIAAIANQFVEKHRPQSITSRVVQFLGSHRAEDVLRVGGEYLDATTEGRDEVCSDVEQILKLYLTCALYGVRPAASLAERIRQTMDETSADGALSDEAAEVFLKILGHNGEVGPLLRSMYETGVLEYVVPPMAHARCLLQFNQYHSYTVDEHSLRAVEAIDDFLREESPVGVACRHVRQLHILRLALLLHDLGKGFEEDHSDVGKRIAEQMAQRLGLSDRKRNMLVFLVHKHLYMSQLGLRRDTTDPDVLLPFSQAVGSPELLRMLFLLTVADLIAVGPGVLTPWKSELLVGLFDRGMRILSGKPYRYMEEERLREIKEHVLASIVPLESDSSDEMAEWIDKQTDAFSPHYLMSTPPEQIASDLNAIHHLEPGEVIVEGENDDETGTVDYRIIAPPDLADGCFHKLAGVLTAKHLKILTARICTTTDGTVVDSFRVHDDDHAGSVPAERIDDVAAAITSTLTRKTAVKQLFQRYLRFDETRDAEPVSDLSSRVVIDNNSSDYATIIDVFAHDRPGLLYTISRAIFKLGLSVSLARIATHLDQVVDVFYVTDTDGGKIADEERINFVREQLEATIGEFEREGHRLFAP
ncbi:MAG: [protein-PII] uridylyltransferase [Planctomycetaceae bacterium]|jgi:[protein-PII] uridylyltransferase|nr:[protein-PII] uridylyltransferase [Planctomycetaceae bacterium]MBT6157360.1 [protein-PII] uridylyltransferase [Planctomycetaceae bacterium]MBT6483859.1 [protein-PII] uridylyltransferase [Planctomycetaceae bacterium]MBT6496099.1 [protein-PII] uridylyltransferase [Planctomycetaceae bacterium]